MQNFQNKEVVVDDLDLFTLLRKGKDLVFKYRKLIVYFLLGGLFLGIIYYVVSPKIYKSRMVVSSSLLNGSAFILIIDDLQRYIEEGNTEEVSRLLNLDQERVKKISKLEVFSSRNFTEKVLSDRISADEVSEDEKSNEYIIEAYVKDNSLLPELQNALVYYVSTNGFVKTLNKSRKENLKLVADNIHKQLKELDSLKTTVNNILSSRSSGNHLTGSVMINDPSALYNNVLELYQSELKTRSEMNKPEIDVIQGFIQYKRHYKPKLMIVMIISLFIAFFSCLIYITGMELKENL